MSQTVLFIAGILIIAVVTGQWLVFFTWLALAVVATVIGWAAGRNKYYQEYLMRKRNVGNKTR